MHECHQVDGPAKPPQEGWYLLVEFVYWNESQELVSSTKYSKKTKKAAMQ